jgi:DNA repair protein RecO (recombination protein O)
MASEKTRAIVLKVVEFSETSCVVTLFTEDFGKVGALAKGARRPKGPFEGAIDLLALIRIVFLRKSSDSLDLLTEAKLERRFRSAQRDLARLHAGYYVAELLTELTERGDPHPALFQAADRTLLAIDTVDLNTAAPLAETIVRFELTALREVGHLPSLDACVVCGRPVAGSGRVPFGMTAGGVLCENCRPGRRRVVSVSSDCVDVLREFSSREGEIARNEAPAEPFVKPEIQGELRAVLNNYFAHLVGHRLRMSESLGGLANN